MGLLILFTWLLDSRMIHMAFYKINNCPFIYCTNMRKDAISNPRLLVNALSQCLQAKTDGWVTWKMRKLWDIIRIFKWHGGCDFFLILKSIPRKRLTNNCGLLTKMPGEILVGIAIAKTFKWIWDSFGKDIVKSSTKTSAQSLWGKVELHQLLNAMRGHEATVWENEYF